MNAIFCLILTFLVSFSSYGQNLIQEEMVQTLNTIKHNFKNYYAPTKWKEEFAGWNLNEEISKLQTEILNDQNIKVKKFHSLLANFFRSTKDYHVSFSLLRTEKARLPFMIKGAENKYVLAYIDRKKLSIATFPFKAGDEIISFAGRPIQDVIAELKVNEGGNTSETDQTLAEMLLTTRIASRGMQVPSGPITIGIKKENDVNVYYRQLIWEHREESIDYSGVEDLLKNDDKNFVLAYDKKELNLKDHLEQTQMISPMAFELSQIESVNPYKVGAKKSFIPSLGKKIWESDKSNPFSAYMYLNKDKNIIGYIRIPSYGAGEKQSLEFEKIITRFNEFTDGLIIDQVNNPGGSVFYLYSLVSMLTDRPMYTPKHRMKITAKDAVSAMNNLKDLEKVKTEEDAKKLFGKTVGGYPISMTFSNFVKDYFRFILNEWQEGRTLTNPSHIWGVDKINPHPRVRYTKPILVLVNEMDFSGGDFFPAIMQDNKRATILGTRTAGAGGYVLSRSIPNLLGLKYFSLTGSLAKRIDDRPLENLGVTPDINYRLTLKDLRKNFKSYVETIKTNINLLIK